MRYIFLGKRLKCAVFLPALVFLWVVFAGYKTALFSLAAAAVHEAGHIISGLAARRKIASVTLSALGADIEYTGAVPYKTDVITALSGPFFSIAAGLLFYRLFPVFSAASLIYGLLNLIPVPCFDGGRALRCALYLFADISKADVICDAVCVFFLIIMYVFSVFLLFYTSFNASLLLICAYVFIKSYVKTK